MSCGFLCFHLCGSGVPVTTTCHCCAVVFLQSRRMRRSLHTLRCVRPLRLMAQLSLACLPPHCGLFSADGLSGGTYTTTSRFSRPGERCTSHKTFCRRRQKLLRLPPDNCPVPWLSLPHRKGPLRGETPKKWTAEGAFAPPGEQPVGPAT